jgi:hypothetical protein
VNRPGAGSASQPRATSRFALDRSVSTRAGTTSMPNAAAISWQASDPGPAGGGPRASRGRAGRPPTAPTSPAPRATPPPATSASPHSGAPTACPHPADPRRPPCRRRCRHPEPAPFRPACGRSPTPAILARPRPVRPGYGRLPRTADSTASGELVPFPRSDNRRHSRPPGERRPDRARTPTASPLLRPTSGNTAIASGKTTASDSVGAILRPLSGFVQGPQSCRCVRGVCPGFSLRCVQPWRGSRPLAADKDEPPRLGKLLGHDHVT